MRRSRQTKVLLLCILVTGYFAYHAINGRHGLEARHQLIERERSLARELANLEAVRRALEREVASLGDEAGGLDSIDEAARATLGYVHPRDVLLTDRGGPR